MGRWLIIAGLILIIIGLIIHFVPGIFNWFGKLPGDIRIEKEQGRVFIPLTSMILISVILTILINLIRFLKK